MTRLKRFGTACADPPVEATNFVPTAPDLWHHLRWQMVLGFEPGSPEGPAGEVRLWVDEVLLIDAVAATVQSVTYMLEQTCDPSLQPLWTGISKMEVGAGCNNDTVLQDFHVDFVAQRAWMARWNAAAIATAPARAVPPRGATHSRNM